MIVSIVAVLQIRKTPLQTSLTRLAVLPLQNLSIDTAETDYLSEGISRALITKLTQIASFQVTPWVTSRRYSDVARPIEEIAALDDGFQKGEIDEAAYNSRRAELKALVLNTGVDQTASTETASTETTSTETTSGDSIDG